MGEKSFRTQVLLWKLPGGRAASSGAGWALLRWGKRGRRFPLLFLFPPPRYPAIQCRVQGWAPGLGTCPSVEQSGNEQVVGSPPRRRVGERWSPAEGARTRSRRLLCPVRRRRVSLRSWECAERGAVFSLLSVALPLQRRARGDSLLFLCSLFPCYVVYSPGLTPLQSPFKPACPRCEAAGGSNGKTLFLGAFGFSKCNPAPRP